MHILLVASAFNSLTQRVHAELRDRGHTVAVELALPGGSLTEAVRRHAPQLVLAPLLKTAIPREVWSAHPCFVVHPGPVGDRGPSSLDWAVQEGAVRWGVTVLQAVEEMDAGDVWASVACPVPPVAKSDLYRGEIADAALAAVLLAVERFASGTFTPLKQDEARSRPHLGQSVRRIDWDADTTDTVLRKLRAADSQPGVLDVLLGDEWYLHGGHPEQGLRGAPGELLATRAGAICRATRDGAVWIPELRRRRRPGGPPTVKLPAVRALGDRLPPLPELPARPDAARGTWTDIRYREEGGVGLLSFSFPGGAMSTERCRRLLDAYREACARPTSVLVLGGQRDFFSNGIHLGVIEATEDPAAESWANIHAIDDLVEAVLTTTDRLVVAALAGNAAAGGVMLALAADEVWCRSGCVLNPHYRLMGLTGSEYWTYTLPRRVGHATAGRLMREALPVSAASARGLGLVDRVVECGPEDFAVEAGRLAARLALLPGTRSRIAAKKAEADRRESTEPLSAFRERELARMHRTFHDPDAPYHALRRAFVRKETPSCTPPHLGSVTAFAPQADARFALARQVADAVVFEGCTLHPDRASATGNRLRRQIGVLVPPAWGAGGEEYDFQHTECLMEPEAGATLAVELRFLRAGRRTVHRPRPGGGFEPVPELRLGERVLVPCDEGTEERVETVVTMHELTARDGVTVAFRRPAGEESEQVPGEDGRAAGRTIRRHEEISGVLRLSARRIDGPCRVLRLTAVVENTSSWAPVDGQAADRGAALPHSLVASHLLMGLTAGSFLSMTHPPEWAKAAIASCRNLHTWPVLVGEPGRADVMLSSPVMLKDHPGIDGVAGPPAGTAEDDPLGEPDADPDGDPVAVAGRPVGPGSRVRLNPGLRRTDAQDVFLRGRTATVEAVRHDLDGSVHLAVTVDDDPGADVRRDRGTFHYFRADEVAPLEDGA